MKLNIDANASRSGGASTRSTRRSRSKLGQAMSEALRALGGRKSDPGEPSPEALEQLARAQEQLARAKGVLQLDRTLSAAERAVAEPSATSSLIPSWIAAAIEGLDDAPTPLDPGDFGEDSADVRAGHADDAAAEVSAGPEALESAEIATSPKAALLADALAGGSVPDEGGEPIRTRTMARLLASHGYLGRALTIYEHLLAQQPDDGGIHAEADAIRDALARKTA